MRWQLGHPTRLMAKARPPTQSTPIPSNSPISGDQVILLSCFDGIGSAAHAMVETIGPPFLHICWEVDPECIAVVKKHFSSAIHRGDFLQEDIHSLAQMVSDHDPNSEKLIVFASAPPCPDFSRVCPDAPGKEGQEGRKFVEFCKFADRVRQQLPHPVKKMLCGVARQRRDLLLREGIGMFGSGPGLDRLRLGEPAKTFLDRHPVGPPTTTSCQWETAEVVQVPEDSAGPHR